MKIGIISFQNADNYGAVLQNYALQQLIGTKGHEVVSINYDDYNLKKGYVTRIFPESFRGFFTFKIIIANLLNYRLSKKHQRAFIKFRKEKLYMTDNMSKAEVHLLDGQYDLFICGSDQVWNINIIGESNIDIYTLGFVKKSKKVSYAASAGNLSNLNNNMINKIKELDVITVREKELEEELLSSVSNKVSLVCDPVFLMKREWWIEEIKAIYKNKKPYVFLYHVGNRSKDTTDLAKYISDKKNIDIRFPIKKSMNNLFVGKCIYDDGPLEFLADIAYADFVVASSFHAVAFAIIFEKQFVVLLHDTTGSRVRDLLSFLGLEAYIVHNKQDYIDRFDVWKAIDYKIVKEKLNAFRQESIHKLEQILQDKTK